MGEEAADHGPGGGTAAREAGASGRDVALRAGGSRGRERADNHGTRARHEPRGARANGSPQPRPGVPGRSAPRRKRGLSLVRSLPDSDPGTVKESTCAALSPPVCGHGSQQPQETTHLLRRLPRSEIRVFGALAPPLRVSGKALDLRTRTPAAGTGPARESGGERTRLPCPPFQRPVTPQA